jgi:hypothetical protein
VECLLNDWQCYIPAHTAHSRCSAALRQNIYWVLHVLQYSTISCSASTPHSRCSCWLHCCTRLHNDAVSTLSTADASSCTCSCLAERLAVLHCRAEPTTLRPVLGTLLQDVVSTSSTVTHHTLHDTTFKDLLARHASGSAP